MNTPLPESFIATKTVNDMTYVVFTSRQSQYYEADLNISTGLMLGTLLDNWNLTQAVKTSICILHTFHRFIIILSSSFQT